MARVAVIGLGGMGSRIARRLADAGNDLVVWNRTPAKAEPLVERGATAAETPAAAARAAEFVITMLADPAALAAVTEGSDGIAAGAQDGSVLLEMSTVGRDAVLRFAELVPPGVELLDAPVLGSLAEVEAGSLTIFVGGSDQAFRRAAPVLEPLGRALHVGPLGQGAAAKLVANSTLVGVIGVLGEAIALADALGLTRETTFDLLGATALADQVGRRRASIESGEYPPRFPLRLANKDAALVVQAGADAGVDLRLARAAEQWFADAVPAYGNLDYSAVLAYILASRAG